MSTQGMLYLALFTLQGALENTGSIVVLILIAGILLAAQIGQAKEHFSYASQIKKETTSEGGKQLKGMLQADGVQLDAEALADRRAKTKKRLSWHSKMIFFPGVVAIFSTIIFLLGMFTVFFAYGRITAEDGSEICASGPVAAIKIMPAA